MPTLSYFFILNQNPDEYANVRLQAQILYKTTQQKAYLHCITVLFVGILLFQFIQPTKVVKT